MRRRRCNLSPRRVGAATTIKVINWRNFGVYGINAAPARATTGCCGGQGALESSKGQRWWQENVNSWTHSIRGRSQGRGSAGFVFAGPESISCLQFCPQGALLGKPAVAPVRSNRGGGTFRFLTPRPARGDEDCCDVGRSDLHVTSCGVHNNCRFSFARPPLRCRLMRSPSASRRGVGGQFGYRWAPWMALAGVLWISPPAAWSEVPHPQRPFFS